MRLVATIALAAALAACGQGETASNAEPAAETAQVAAGSGTLAEALDDDPRFAGLVRAAGMDSILSGKEPYTILAPTPEALAALPAGTLERLQRPDARAELTALLRAHVLPGTVLAADLTRAVEAGQGRATLATMGGTPLTVTRDGQALRVGAGAMGARIVGAEAVATNGVVHRIDAVLPAATAEKSETAG